MIYEAKGQQVFCYQDEKGTKVKFSVQRDTCLFNCAIGRLWETMLTGMGQAG